MQKAMAETGKGALEVLEEIRAKQFGDVPAPLLSEAFALETEAQFDAERGPTVAKLRDLIRSAAETS